MGGCPFLYLPAQASALDISLILYKSLSLVYTRIALSVELCACGTDNYCAVEAVVWQDICAVFWLSRLLRLASSTQSHLPVERAIGKAPVGGFCGLTQPQHFKQNKSRLC